MYSASFIYEVKGLDDEYHRLDQLIEEVAHALPGFLGAEVWHSSDGKRNNAIYYWKDLDTLKAFSEHPRHMEAKRQYARWYAGFHIVISEVIRSYGDAAFGHITPDQRQE